MNRLPWLKRCQLNAIGVGRWASALVHTCRRIVQLRATRITICVAQGGFTATLLSPNSRQTCHISWQDDPGSRQPELLWKRLPRTVRDIPVDLELPKELVLSHSVKLPKAALSNLSEAIIYGLPAWSPFQADDVHVSGSLEEVRDGQALVRLHYVLKAKANPLIARLEALGLPVDRLVLDAASRSTVGLLTPKLARIKRAHQIDGVLAATAAALLLIFSTTQVIVLSQRIEELKGKLRSELIATRQGEALQTAFSAFRARRAAVAERRAREVSASELLSALSRRLPDGVLIQALEVGSGRGRLELSGASPDTILQGLRATPLIRHPTVEGVHVPRMIVRFNLVERSL